LQFGITIEQCESIPNGIQFSTINQNQFEQKIGTTFPSRFSLCLLAFIQFNAIIKIIDLVDWLREFAAVVVRR
jgi:hypothetical protein